MVQIIFVKADPIDPDLPPIVDPGISPIYRIDQGIVWKIVADDWQWDTDQGPAIQFDEGWQGSQPVQIGTVPVGEPDVRLIQAAGPGPNMDTEPQQSTYTINVKKIEGSGNAPNIRGLSLFVDAQTNTPQAVKIDPDIENRPQP